MELVLIIAALALYFLPSFVANARRHKNATAILVFNVFFGWSLLGWIIALIWACANNVEVDDVS